MCKTKKTPTISARKERRPNWPDSFVEWLCYLLNFSIGSAVGEVKDNWYNSKQGMPTGGSCFVPSANIPGVTYLMIVAIQTICLLESCTPKA